MSHYRHTWIRRCSSTRLRASRILYGGQIDETETSCGVSNKTERNRQYPLPLSYVLDEGEKVDQLEYNPRIHFQSPASGVGTGSEVVARCRVGIALPDVPSEFAAA